MDHHFDVIAVTILLYFLFMLRRNRVLCGRLYVSLRFVVTLPEIVECVKGNILIMYRQVRDNETTVWLIVDIEV